MLTCVYHPIDGMRVVEADEADKLKASGFWFDSPAKAKAYRNEVEKQVIQERDKPKRAYKKREKQDEGFSTK